MKKFNSIAMCSLVIVVVVTRSIVIADYQDPSPSLVEASPSLVEVTVEKAVVEVVSTTATPTPETIKLPSKYNYSSKFFQDFSEEDRFILYRIVEAEAEGQGYEPKRNVAAVIFNRLRSEEFPNTVYEVVFQKNPVQFSPTIDGRYWSVEITEETKEAVINTYNENYVALDAIYFGNIPDVENLRTQEWFRNLEHLFTDASGHSFFKERGIENDS